MINSGSCVVILKGAVCSFENEVIIQINELFSEEQKLPVSADREVAGSATNKQTNTV